MKAEYDFSKGKRGQVSPIDKGKIRITIRLDADIVAFFKTKAHDIGGGNYQTIINDVLRESIHRQPAEDVIRRIIREEVQALKATA